MPSSKIKIKATFFFSHITYFEFLESPAKNMLIRGVLVLKKSKVILLFVAPRVSFIGCYYYYYYYYYYYLFSIKSDIIVLCVPCVFSFWQRNYHYYYIIVYVNDSMVILLFVVFTFNIFLFSTVLSQKKKKNNQLILFSF